jgi:RNA polymerase primary sigma factor
MAFGSSSERDLVLAVLAGKPGAAARFLEIASQPIWSVATQLDGKPEAAFRHVVAALASNGFSRLKSFDGCARLSTYLALVARDILAERLARCFVEAPREAWPRFERFFASDIRRRISRRFPRAAGSAMHDDAYQEICLKLIEHDYRRIRAYHGQGSFVGYVLTTIERILIDLLRRDRPRRRLPAAVARLPEFEQAVYEAMAWDGCPADTAQLIRVLQSRFPAKLEPEDVRLAMQRISPLVQREPTGQVVSLESVMESAMVADPAASPEEQLLLAEEERARVNLIAAVREAAAALPPAERAYLQIVFSATDPLPPREIARLLRCDATEVYRLKQWAQRWLAEFAAGLQKNQSLSV